MKDLITNQLYTLKLNPLVMSTSQCPDEEICRVCFINNFLQDEEERDSLMNKRCACDVYDVRLTCSKAAS